MNNGFYGREKEITWLFDAFKKVATRDKGVFTGPQILAVLSESGLGKSRLVQELYFKIAGNETYNPDAFGYWPKQFGDLGDTKLVSPNMMGQEAPNGPPKFIWLGARWEPIDEKDYSNRKCKFPEINEELEIHNKIIQANSSAWRNFWGRSVNTIKNDFTGEARGQITGDLIKYAFDVSVPMAGLFASLLMQVKGVLDDKNSLSPNPAQIKTKKRKDEVEEMLSAFNELLNNTYSVPVVLWLDDAHWADDRMQSFIRQLVDRAKKDKWPLLIVFTHWEREYNKEQIEGPTTISDVIYKLPECCRLVLEKIAPSFFEVYLTQNLPGLTKPQVKLLCEKADGNFLTMVENVGHLINETGYFEGENIESALNELGEDEVKTYEAIREKRVEQRFGKLAPKVFKDILALGADQGVRFMPEIIVKYLNDNVEQQEELKVKVHQCINPYAILSQVESTREFRDRLYVNEARKYFKKFYRDDVLNKWNEVIFAWLAEQISNCFDESGNLKANLGNEKLYFINGSRSEKLTLIALANDKLDLSVYSPLAVKFVHLSCLSFEDDRTWTEIRKLAEKIEDWNWEDSNIGKDISIEMLINMQAIFKTSGAYSIALKIAVIVFKYFNQLAEELPTLENQRYNMASLFNAASMLEELDNLSAAVDNYKICLGIAHQLAEELGTPESRRDVSACLNRIGCIEKNQGKLNEALLTFKQSLKISQQLAEELGTSESQLDLSVNLIHVAGIELEQGKLSEALLKFQESLKICKQLTEKLETPENRRSVCNSLDRIADIEQLQGLFPKALLKYQQSLEIRQQLAKVLFSPESLRDVSISLKKIAVIEMQTRQVPQALIKLQESLEIRQQLAEELGTPQSRRDVDECLESIDDANQILDKQNELLLIKQKILDHEQEMLPDIVNIIDRADVALDSLQESPEIHKYRPQEFDTPAIIREKSNSLHDIAEIEKEKGNLPQALQMYQLSLLIRKQLVKDLPTLESRLDVTNSLNSIAEIELKLDNVPQALLRYEETVEIYQQLNKEQPNSKYLQLIFSNLTLIAQIEYSQVKTPEEHLSFQKRQSIRIQLINELPELKSLWGSISNWLRNLTR